MRETKYHTNKSIRRLAYIKGKDLVMLFKGQCREAFVYKKRKVIPVKQRRSFAGSGYLLSIASDLMF